MQLRQAVRQIEALGRAGQALQAIVLCGGGNDVTFDRLKPLVRPAGDPQGPLDRDEAHGGAVADWTMYDPSLPLVPLVLHIEDNGTTGDRFAVAAVIIRDQDRETVFEFGGDVAPFAQGRAGFGNHDSYPPWPMAHAS